MRSPERNRAVVLAIALITALPVAGGAQGEAPGSAPVHIDFIVNDGAGRPVAELRAADIEVRENGVVQTVDELVFVSRAADGAGEMPAGRIIGILLDEFHVEPASSGAVREAVLRFIERDIRVNDRIVLVKPLDSLGALRAAGDPADVRERVLRFEGRKGDFEPRTAFEASTMSRAPAAAAPERARVALSALAALVQRLGPLGEGRKSIVFVSEGFAESAPRGRLRGAGVQTIVDAAGRAGVAIYAIDPRASAGAAVVPDDPEAGDSGRDMLRTLAERTGGLYATADGASDALAAAARDLDGYYRASYRPSAAAEGRHPLEVRVNRANAGVRVRAARWSVREPSAEPAARAANVLDAMRLPRRPQQISPLIDTWFGTARAPDGRTRVTFTWEPRTRVPPPAAWLTLRAVGEDGQVLFDGRVEPIRAIGVGGGPGLSAVFEATPGGVQIDMTIRAPNGEVIGTDSRDMRVPDLSRSATVLSTPAIIRTYNALQFRTLSNDPEAPPSVSRRFGRNERLLVRLHAYASATADAGHPDVTARLVGRRQETLRDLDRLREAPAPDLVQFDLPLSSLPPGEYGVEIRAGDRRELVMFDVTR